MPDDDKAANPPEGDETGSRVESSAKPEALAETQPAAETTVPPMPKSRPAPKPITLTLPRSKGRLALLALVGVVGLVLLSMVFYSLYLYTESTEFCTACHVMYPEKMAHDSSPHERTECGTCHVGPGAVAAVQAKIASARYVVVYPLSLYERPIPSPIHSLRPAEIVCNQCHWPQKFYSDRLRTIPDYAQDEKNSLTRTQMMLRTGGGAAQAGLGRGIHWHIENPVYYIATDEKRQIIPWVQAQYGGMTIEYLATDSTLSREDIARAEKRKMDCIDCHNRATHDFVYPDDALDAALSTGSIAADLPYIKREGAKVLLRSYATEAEAVQTIAAVEDFYRTNYPDVYARREADVRAAVAGLQTIFNNTQFPFMNVTWQSHTNNIGHKLFPGCFRCHDGKHLSTDNQAIRLECNICHSIPQVAGPGKPLPAIEMTKGVEPGSHQTTTWLAEHRYKFDATCAACHTISNPGGSDNTSFCSNSACHGSEWKYIGLNAPKIRELTAPAKAPSTGTPRPIPHPFDNKTDCAVCHDVGKVHPYPANHTSFTIDMCTTCHKPMLQPAAPPQPTAVPTSAATATTVAASPTARPATPTLAPTLVATVAASPTARPTAPTTAPPAAPSATPGKVEEPALIPHPIAGRDNCLLCHNPTGGMKPAPQNHLGRTNETCLTCHKPK